MASMKEFIDRRELTGRELLAALFATNFTIILALLLGVKIYTEKDFTQTIPAPWVFAGIQWLLQYVSPVWAGVYLPMALVLIIVLFPYLSRIIHRAAVYLLWIVLLLITALTAFGYLVRI